MYEVEVKVPADHERVRERLADLDVPETRRVTQIDRYYDAPHRSFADTDEALRVRRERTGDDERVEVTYKGPLVDEASKTREEVQTTVADEAAIDLILERLGFDAAATVRKERTFFDVDGYTVTLDDVADVGRFVEVETTATEAERDRARQGAFDVLERLGLDPDDQVRTSYLGLLLDDSTASEEEITG